MRKTLVLAGTALATVMSQSALAGDGMEDGAWYLSAAVGANWADGFFDLPSAGTFTTSDGIDSDTGWSVAASVGRHMGNLRLEAELTGRWNDFDGRGGSPTGSVVFTGDIPVLAAMANAVVDIGLGESMALMLGAGAGYAWADLDLTIDATTTLGFSTHGAVSESDSGFAYQGIAGISMQTGERSEVFLEYRYFAVNSMDAFAPIIDDYSAHTVRVGLRFDMNGGH